MGEVINSGACPELKDLETKLGMKTPESLLRSMREDYTSDERALDTDGRVGLPEELLEKIKNLKLQMEQLRSADVKILRQFLTLHEGMEMLRWLQGDRSSTLTSRTGSLTGSQSSLGDVAFMTHGAGGESPNCCSHTTPEITLHGPSPSPSGSTQCCSTSLEDSGDHAWSPMSLPNAKDSMPYNGIPAAPEQNAAKKGIWQVHCQEDSALSAPSSGLAQSNTVEGEVCDRCEGGCQIAEEGTELSLGQSEALLGYDTHWCWVESKDDVTFL